MVVFRSPKRRRQPTLVLGCYVDAVLNKELCEIRYSDADAAKTTRPRLRRHVCATQDEELCEIDMTILQRSTQRTGPVLVLGYHLRAVLGEELCKINIVTAIL